jgi:hypothetical protein
MPIVPTFDSSHLKELRAALKGLDVDLTKQMNRDIKKPAAEMAKRIEAGTPVSPIVSGMAHNGRTGLGKIKATGYGPSRKSLARIELFSKPEAAGFKIADLAGTRNKVSKRTREYTRMGPSGLVTVRAHTSNTGQALIDALDKKAPLLGDGGRFGWRQFIAERPRLVREVTAIVDKFCDMTVRKVTR